MSGILLIRFGIPKFIKAFRAETGYSDLVGSVELFVSEGHDEI